ncbi:MAG TPA: DUF488 domain-containing protein [Gemmatimonadales bacterium]|nr:DUF488 domain-containing protein [Gemmatimonadales bacterium]
MVYTIGHSTREFPEFLRLLESQGIGHLVDVRRYPASRRHPQYARAALEEALLAAGIAYTHEQDLGGRRQPRPDSPHSGWRSPSFRGYADYMDTDAFQAALGRLIALASESRTAVMCAEAVPWRCHRQLIADALVARGHDVGHILSETRVDAHRLTPFARIESDGRVRYPAVPEQLDLTGMADADS